MYSSLLPWPVWGDGGGEEGDGPYPTFLGALLDPIPPWIYYVKLSPAPAVNIAEQHSLLFVLPRLALRWTSVRLWRWDSMTAEWGGFRCVFPAGPLRRCVYHSCLSLARKNKKKVPVSCRYGLPHPTAFANCSQISG